MRNFLNYCLVLLLFPNSSFSQVGIGTSEPKATLDININSNNYNAPDGVLIPRISGDDLRAKSNLYTEYQDGAMIFVTSPDSAPQDKTVDVISSGFYYYNSVKEKWIKISGSNNLWMTQKENLTDISEVPNSFNDHVYRMGRVAIGTDGLTSVNLPQSGEIYNQFVYPSTSHFELRGNYNIRSGAYDPNNPSKGLWYIDQLASSESFPYFNNYSSRIFNKSKSIFKDPLLENTQLLRNIENRINGKYLPKQSLESIPSARMTLFGQEDNFLIPMVGTIFPSVNFDFRKSYSFTYQEPYNQLTRVWNFEPNVMNSVTLGYVDGRINMQTLRLPEVGQTADDYTISMSRILIEKPYNHLNSINLENQNVVNDVVNDEYSRTNHIRLDKNGITFVAKNYDMNHIEKQDGGSYTFPRYAPDNNQVLYYGGNGILEWKEFNINFDGGLATLPQVDSSMIAADTTGKAIVTKEYLENIIPSTTTSVITVPSPPSDGKFSLISENGILSWQKIE